MIRLICYHYNCMLTLMMLTYIKCVIILCCNELISNGKKRLFVCWKMKISTIVD